MSLPRDREQGSLFQAGRLLEGLFEHKQRRRFELFYEKVMPALWAVREKLEGVYSKADGRPAIRLRERDEASAFAEDVASAESSAESLDPVVLAGVALLH